MGDFVNFYSMGVEREWGFFKIFFGKVGASSAFDYH